MVPQRCWIPDAQLANIVCQAFQNFRKLRLLFGQLGQMGQGLTPFDMVTLLGRPFKGDP